MSTQTAAAAPCAQLQPASPPAHTEHPYAIAADQAHLLVLLPPHTTASPLGAVDELQSMPLSRDCDVDAGILWRRETQGLLPSSCLTNDCKKVRNSLARQSAGPAAAALCIRQRVVTSGCAASRSLLHPASESSSCKKPMYVINLQQMCASASSDEDAWLLCIPCKLSTSTDSRLALTGPQHGW